MYDSYFDKVLLKSKLLSTNVKQSKLTIFKTVAHRVAFRKIAGAHSVKSFDSLSRDSFF